ncbi:hypothetical protein SALBM135S_03108 [Streptomyces alboniger]
MKGMRRSRPHPRTEVSWRGGLVGRSYVPPPEQYSIRGGDDRGRPEGEGEQSRTGGDGVLHPGHQAERARRPGGKYLTAVSTAPKGSIARISGQDQHQPTKAPMAPGTERSSAPRPSAMTLSSVMAAELDARAPNTPESVRDSSLSEPESQIWARVNVTERLRRQGRPVVGRPPRRCWPDDRTRYWFGTAVRLARIMPVEYSPAVTRMPRTARQIWESWLPKRVRTTVSISRSRRRRR